MKRLVSILLLLVGTLSAQTTVAAKTTLFSKTSLFLAPTQNAPLLAQYIESDWTHSPAATSLTTNGTVFWDTGDLVIVGAMTEGSNSTNTVNTPTVSGLTFSAVETVSPTANCFVALWKATAASAGSGQITATLGATSSQGAGLAVWVWKNSVGVGAHNHLNLSTTVQTISLTPTGLNSGFVWLAGDWAATGTGSNTPTDATSNVSGSYSRQSGTMGGHYSYFVGDLAQYASTSSLSLGTSGASGYTMSVVGLEVKGDTIPAAVAPTFSPTFGTTPLSVTLASSTSGSSGFIYWSLVASPTTSDTNSTTASVPSGNSTLYARVIGLSGYHNSVTSKRDYPCSNYLVIDGGANTGGTTPTTTQLGAQTYGASGGSTASFWGVNGTGVQYASGANRPLTYQSPRMCGSSTTYSDSTSSGFVYSTTTGGLSTIRLHFNNYAGGSNDAGGAVASTATAAMKVCSTLPQSGSSCNLDLFAIYSSLGSFTNVPFQCDGTSNVFRMEAGSGNAIVLPTSPTCSSTSGTWYDLTIDWIKNGISHVAVWDEQGFQVGSTWTRTTENDDAATLVIGNNLANTPTPSGKGIYFDKIRLCYSGTCVLPHYNEADMLLNLASTTSGSVTTANLTTDTKCNYQGGGWSGTATGITYSNSVTPAPPAFLRPRYACGVGYSSNNGITTVSDNNAGTGSYAYTPTTVSSANLAAGFWYMTDATNATGASIATTANFNIQSTGTGFSALSLSRDNTTGNLFLDLETSNAGTATHTSTFGISRLTWYWISIQHVPGGKSSMQIYDSSGTLLTTLTATINEPAGTATNVNVGPRAGSGATNAGNAYIHGLILNYTNGAYVLPQ